MTKYFLMFLAMIAFVWDGWTNKEPTKSLLPETLRALKSKMTLLFFFFSVSYENSFMTLQMAIPLFFTSSKILVTTPQNPFWENQTAPLITKTSCPDLSTDVKQSDWYCSGKRNKMFLRLWNFRHHRQTEKTWDNGERFQESTEVTLKWQKKNLFIQLNRPVKTDWVWISKLKCLALCWSLRMTMTPSVMTHGSLINIKCLINIKDLWVISLKEKQNKNFFWLYQMNRAFPASGELNDWTLMGGFRNLIDVFGPRNTSNGWSCRDR